MDCVILDIRVRVARIHWHGHCCWSSGLKLAWSDLCCTLVDALLLKVSHLRTRHAVGLGVMNLLAYVQISVSVDSYTSLQVFSRYFPNFSNRSPRSPDAFSRETAASCTFPNCSSDAMAENRRAYSTNLRLLTYSCCMLPVSASRSTLLTSSTVQPTSFSGSDRNVFSRYLPNCS